MDRQDCLDAYNWADCQWFWIVIYREKFCMLGGIGSAGNSILWHFLKNLLLII